MFAAPRPPGPAKKPPGSPNGGREGPLSAGGDRQFVGLRAPSSAGPGPEVTGLSRRWQQTGTPAGPRATARLAPGRPSRPATARNGSHFFSRRTPKLHEPKPPRRGQPRRGGLPGPVQRVAGTRLRGRVSSFRVSPLCGPGPAASPLPAASASLGWGDNAIDHVRRF